MRRRALLLMLAAVPALTGGATRALAEEKKKGGGESFLQFQALTATIMRADGHRGVLTVEAGLDVPDGGLRTRAEESQPRLRDAYVRYLITYAASIPVGGPPNPEAIGLSLQRATDQVLGKPGARLLLGTILIN